MKKESYLKRFRKYGDEPRTNYEKKVLRKYLREREALGRRVSVLDKVTAGWINLKNAVTTYQRKVVRLFNKITRRPDPIATKTYDNKTVKYFDVGMDFSEFSRLVAHPPQLNETYIAVGIYYESRDGEDKFMQSSNIKRDESDEIILRDANARFKSLMENYDVKRLTGIAYVSIVYHGKRRK